MPSNFANARAATDAPAFPEMPEEVTRGTVARCLPDRFIVRVFPRGGAPITVSGAALARDIPISPIALSNLQDLVAAGNGLTVPAGAEWAVDFAKAKQAGLGIEVQLPAGTQVLDRIVVVGVRGSVSESENAADFADLLLSHRYSDGFGVLAQGTPTNNTEAARSPYKVSATPAAPPLRYGQPSADLARLASLIGVDPAAVERLLTPADSRPTLETTQQAANTALWFATWEPVLQRSRRCRGAGGDARRQIESARRLHRDHVRGAGPAPVIRVGAQPYGILPVSDLDAWVPRSGDTTASLVPLIRRTVGRWVQRARSLPRVRPWRFDHRRGAHRGARHQPDGNRLASPARRRRAERLGVRGRDGRARAPSSTADSSSSRRCSRSIRSSARAVPPARFSPRRNAHDQPAARLAARRRGHRGDSGRPGAQGGQRAAGAARPRMGRREAQTVPRRAGAVRPATSRTARAQSRGRAARSRRSRAARRR